jgi:hypothetical protein
MASSTVGHRAGALRDESQLAGDGMGGRRFDWLETVRTFKKWAAIK